MTIGVVGTSSNSGTSSSLSVSVPAGVVEGDLVLLAAVADNGSDNAAVSTPSGFTKLVTGGVNFGGADMARLRVFYKIAAAGESGNYNLTFTGGIEQTWNAKGLCRVFRGHKLPLGDTAKDTDGALDSKDLTAPSVNAVETDSLLVCFWGVGEGSAGVSGWPAGMSNVLKVSGNSDAELMIAQDQLVASGSTSVRILTIEPSSPWASVSMIIDTDSVIHLPLLWDNV